jgi:hypothetical protein
VKVVVAALKRESPFVDPTFRENTQSVQQSRCFLTQTLENAELGLYNSAFRNAQFLGDARRRPAIQREVGEGSPGGGLEIGPDDGEQLLEKRISWVRSSISSPSPGTLASQ